MSESKNTKMSLCSNYDGEELGTSYMMDGSELPKECADNEDGVVGCFVYCSRCSTYMEYENEVFTCPSCGESVTKARLYQSYRRDNRENRYL